LPGDWSGGLDLAGRRAAVAPQRIPVIAGLAGIQPAVAAYLRTHDVAVTIETDDVCALGAHLASQRPRIGAIRGLGHGRRCCNHPQQERRKDAH
jgi:hypothetical protein